jgi:hypothetical protein
MPHTSRYKKPARQKRTQTVDEDGWTRVSSHHHNTRAKEPMLDRCMGPHPIADGMTEEKAMERYTVIEKKWLESESFEQLSKAVREAIKKTTVEVKSCICFGTSSMTSARDGWIIRHDVAHYQVAAFKSVIDILGAYMVTKQKQELIGAEQVQSSRPMTYAQEPAYNVFDKSLLNKLQITPVDSPTGWTLIEPSSFVYCPGAEQFVSIMALEKNPAFYLTGPLDWLRGQQAERGCPNYVSTSFEVRPRDAEDQRTILAIIDSYVNEHNVQNLSDLDAPDYPFHDMVLYWPKPVED